MNNVLWYKNAVFYEIYVRAFHDSTGDGHGDLRGLMEKLDYLHELGIDCIWLMPIYPSPLKDGGYDIEDYYGIDETFGTLDDFKSLTQAAHARNMRVIMDLVLNHTSDNHRWFKASRSDHGSPYRDYYVWSDTDRKFGDARIIFLDTETSNWTFDEHTGQYYWHRFYASQPDLNYDNPRVQEEMINVARFWLDLGIDGFRADAVPYLFEREGTNCENLPETHAYLKRLRNFLDENYPGRILLCEANQWPEDVRPYFGEGDEFHMGFHFPLMPRIFMSLKKERADDMLEILRRTPPIPENCQWGVFLRNHDELTLEMVTSKERRWMRDQYAPDPSMRINLGIRRRLAPLLDNDRRKIELANSLLFTLTGSPVLYYGDEIGMGDNTNLPDRDGVRTPMQWNDGPNAGFTGSKPFVEMITGDYGCQNVNVADQLASKDSLLHSIKRMIAIRKEHRAFGYGTITWIDVGNPSVAVYVRRDSDEVLLVLNNLSSSIQIIRLPVEHHTLHLDLFNGGIVNPSKPISIPPHSYLWLQKMK